MNLILIIIELLGHLTLRALLQIQEIFYSRTAGKYDAKPTDPLFIQKAPNGVAVRQAETSGANEEISIGTLRDRFLDHHKDIWAEKTVEKYTANLAICCQVIGADTPVRQITKANIRALRDTLAWLLANFAKRYPNSSIRVLVNTARRMNRAGMSPSTVNSYLGSLSSAFSWAGPEGYADSNPVLGITVPDPVHAADKRSPFSPSHLQAIFDAPTYRGMRSAPLLENVWRPNRTRCQILAPSCRSLHRNAAGGARGVTGAAFSVRG